MTGPDRLVVVGASLAGIRAVEAARRRGHDGAITLVGAESHLPYDRPPLSKAFLDEKEPAELTPFRTEEHLVRELGVELRLGVPATALDPVRRVVALGHPSGSGGTQEEVPYDAVVVATGASARTLPGTEGVSGVHALRTLDDARAVRSALDAGARTVVVGAGFIGSEVASAARKRGLEVTIVEAEPVPLTRSIGREAGAVCTDLHRANGASTRFGVGVERIEATGGAVRAAALTDGSRVEADLVVAGIGVVPATGWLRSSGVALHERDGGLLCDATLATSLPDVWGAGDVAHWPNALFDDEVMRLEHWTNAAEHGAAAAAHAIDPAGAAPVASVPYFWSDWYDHRLQFVGVPRADEVRVLATAPYLALYRRGDRLVGVLTIDRPTQIMKFRRLVGQGARWDDALAFAADKV